MSIKRIKSHFTEAQEALTAFLAEEKNLLAIESAGKLMVESLKNGGKIMSCGNGGSLSDAVHFAEELTGKYRENRKPFSAIALSDSGHMSCVANDYGYEYVFSRLVESLGKSGDVLLAISTSGNSLNILRAVETAQTVGIKVVGLTGKDGGKLGRQADVEIRAPHSQYADRAQEIHIKVIHSLIDYIEQSA
jgi:D-sedoheptulose 7-phosphate isomerase